jgi:L-Ala-D/L-Glu epimerase
MLPQLDARSERWPLNRPFRISRGEKTAADVVIAELGRNGAVGRGECVPYARYGETMESVREQIAAMAPGVSAGLTRAGLASGFPSGAARNAVDCALWDLEAKESGIPVETRLGAPLPDELVTAVTVSLGAPEAMAEAAAEVRHVQLVKVKVGCENPERALRAVRAAAPAPALIVDPNESWSVEQLQSLLPLLNELDVALLEQPVPADDDAGLEGFSPSVPICADEAIHSVEDLDRVARRYQAVNIKLDKTGGLTAALELHKAARRRGLGIMAGCMVCTSLGIAPALHIARMADFVDLDGPWWLARDRDPAIRIVDGRLIRPTGGWGHPTSTL